MHPPSSALQLNECLVRPPRWRADEVGYALCSFIHRYKPVSSPGTWMENPGTVYAAGLIAWRAAMPEAWRCPLKCFCGYAPSSRNHQ